jgi:hypothetical protein
MTASEKKLVKFMSGRYPLVISILVPAIMGFTAMLFVKSPTDRAPLWIAIGLTFVVIIVRAMAHRYADRLVAAENKK